MKHSGLQGQLSTEEAGQGDEGGGGLDELGKGRRLHTSEVKHKKGFDEWTNV